MFSCPFYCQINRLGNELGQEPTSEPAPKPLAFLLMDEIPQYLLGSQPWDGRALESIFLCSLPIPQWGRPRPRPVIELGPTPYPTHRHPWPSAGWR